MVDSESGAPYVHKPDHPRARTSGYVREAILVAEDKVGRPLKENETVVHLNRDSSDLRPSNLEVMTKGEAASFYNRQYSTREMLVLFAWLALHLGHTPTQSEVNEEGRIPSHGTYYNRFGSFSEVAKAACLEPNERFEKAKDFGPEFYRRWKHLVGVSTPEQALEADHAKREEEKEVEASSV